MKALVSLALLALTQAKSFPGDDLEVVNNRPIIGVLSQPLLYFDRNNDTRFDGYESYIMKNYVTSLESAGARVVPLIYHSNHEDELKKLPHLNGVLFAGGAGGFDYNDFGQKIFDWAKEQNDKGNFFPLWGTCLGFQDLVRFASSDIEYIGNYTNVHYALPLEFIVNPESSDMWRNFQKWELEALQNKNISFLSHHHGFGLHDFWKDPKIRTMYRPTSIMKAEEGTNFISSMEAYEYPFYGTQFHAEKEFLSFDPEYRFNHDLDSEEINRKYFDFFVAKTRKNNNSFASYDDEVDALIENYDLILTKRYEGADYVFKGRPDKKKEEEALFF